MSYRGREGFFTKFKNFITYIPERIGEIQEEAAKYELIFTARNQRELYRIRPLMALLIFCIVNLFSPGLVVFALLGGLLAGVKLRVRRLY